MLRIASMQLIEDFKSYLISLKQIQIKLKHEQLNLDNDQDYVDFDDINELRRKVQLECEKLIAFIKQSNHIDVNKENDLEAGTVDQIQDVLKQNKDKIDRIDMFETKHKKFKKEFSDLFQTNYDILNKEIKKQNIFVNFFVSSWEYQFKYQNTPISKFNLEKANEIMEKSE